MVTVYEPHLFGVAEMLQPSCSHGLRAEVDTEIPGIDSDKAMQLFSEHNMWEEVTGCWLTTPLIWCIATI